MTFCAHAAAAEEAGRAAQEQLPGPLTHLCHIPIGSLAAYHDPLQVNTFSTHPEAFHLLFRIQDTRSPKELLCTALWALKRCCACGSLVGTELPIGP